MKSPKFLNIFKNRGSVKKQGSFSDFFLHASSDEKKKVFREAANRANRDQRELLKHSKSAVK